MPPEEPREKISAQRHELFEVLAMHQIGGEFCDIIPISTETGENVTEIIEYALELRLKIVLANHSTIRTNGELARNEKQVTGTNPRCMGVKSLCRRSAFRVLKSHSRHV